MARSIWHSLAIVPAIALVSCGSDVPLPEKTAQQLMAQDVQPTAEIYWNSVRYVSDETGNHDYMPETDEEWEETRLAAAKLGDLGNLLLTPAYANGRGDAWVDFAQGLVDMSARAEQTAVDQDVDAVFEVGGLVYNVCKACHQAYPPEEVPEGESDPNPRPSEGTSLEEYSE